jgi:hypothetical protein
MLLFYTCMLCYLRRVFFKMHHLGSGNRFFWLDRPRKISLPRAQRTGIHACIRRATSSIPQLLESIRWRRPALTYAATRVAHARAWQQRKCPTNIIQHLQSVWLTDHLPSISSIIWLYIFINLHVKAHTLYTSTSLSKIIVTNFSRFVCIYTLKHV